MKLEHVVRPGREHSNGVRRREEDRLAVPGGSIEPLDGRRLLATLRRICHENGVTFYPLLTPDENRAGFSAANAFLNECQASGTDPRTFMQALAIHWKHFPAGALKETGGCQIYLPSEVSFLHFYRFHSEILKWLNENTRGINNG